MPSLSTSSGPLKLSPHDLDAPILPRSTVRAWTRCPSAATSLQRSALKRAAASRCSTQRSCRPPHCYEPPAWKGQWRDAGGRTPGTWRRVESTRRSRPSPVSQGQAGVISRPEPKYREWVFFRASSLAAPKTTTSTSGPSAAASRWKRARTAISASANSSDLDQLLLRAIEDEEEILHCGHPTHLTAPKRLGRPSLDL